MKKLYSLRAKLKSMGLMEEVRFLYRIIKMSAMPGIDHPTEETDVEGIGEVLKHLKKKENQGKFIFLDNPKGTKKRFGQKNYRRMPFHYGEFTEVTNPADDMGWDVIIVPSVRLVEDAPEEETDHVPPGHNLVPVGYVPVNESREEWTRRTRSPSRPDGKPAPVGNDKIILAPSEGWEDRDEDKRKIEEFFEPMWNFNDVIWL